MTSRISRKHQSTGRRLPSCWRVLGKGAERFRASGSPRRANCRNRWTAWREGGAGLLAAVCAQLEWQKKTLKSSNWRNMTRWNFSNFVTSSSLCVKNTLCENQPLYIATRHKKRRPKNPTESYVGQRLRFSLQFAAIDVKSSILAVAMDTVEFFFQRFSDPFLRSFHRCFSECSHAF